MSLGIGGHQSASMMSDTWLTPPSVLKALGPFDLDPCCPLNMPWQTAARMYHWPKDDGLMLPWAGRVWLNPPYGKRAGLWLERMSLHGIGTALLFARTETSMFFKWVWRDASALLFLEGRLNFCLADGAVSTKNAGGPSVLIAYGDDDVDRLAASGIGGAFVPLPNRGQVVIAFSVTWLELVLGVFKRTGGELSLSELYVMLSNHPKAKANQHWKEKLRQIVQREDFVRLAPGLYKLARKQEEIFA